MSKEKKKKILLTMHYVERVGVESSLREGFSETISFLQSLGHEVILLGDIPRYTVHAEHCIFGRSIAFVTDFCSISSFEFDRSDIQREEVVKEVLEIYGGEMAPDYSSVSEDNSQPEDNSSI